MQQKCRNLKKKILVGREDRTGDYIVIEQPPYPLDHIDLYTNLLNLKNINIEKRNLEDFEMKIQFLIGMSFICNL